VTTEPVLGKPGFAFLVLVVAHNSGLREACWPVRTPSR
jgi:hypothetical protein